MAKFKISFMAKHELIREHILTLPSERQGKPVSPLHLPQFPCPNPSLASTLLLSSKSRLSTLDQLVVLRNIDLPQLSTTHIINQPMNL
jgi:hypothetical protein